MILVLCSLYLESVDVTVDMSKHYMSFIRNLKSQSNEHIETEKLLTHFIISEKEDMKERKNRKINKILAEEKSIVFDIVILCSREH